MGQADAPDFDVHISNEDMWDLFIYGLESHPCSYYAVAATKDNHVNHRNCVGQAYEVDVLDGFGNYTPFTAMMSFGYLMLVDESPFWWDENEPVGLECDPAREVLFDGFWEDEIAFGCTLLDDFLCIQPPAQAIRLRAYDDIGNWKRSDDLIPEIPAYEPDVIYLHPNESDYSIFEWTEYGVQGDWNTKDQYQQYVNYPVDLEHPGNHEGYIIPILYDVLPKIPGDIIVIRGLLDPPIDDSLDDPPTNPGATYDFDIKNNNSGVEMEFMFGNSLNISINQNPKVIIIMNHPQAKSFSFSEPIGQSLIVYQKVGSDEFETVKLGDEFNSKKLTIKGTDFNGFPYSTPLLVDLRKRGEFRLHGFQWIEK